MHIWQEYKNRSGTTPLGRDSALLVLDVSKTSQSIHAKEMNIRECLF